MYRSPRRTAGAAVQSEIVLPFGTSVPSGNVTAIEID